MKSLGYVREELLNAAEQSLASTRQTLEKERSDAAAYRKHAEAQAAAKDRNLAALNDKLEQAAKEKKAIVHAIASLEAKMARNEERAKKALAGEKERSARVRKELAAKAAHAQSVLNKALREAESRERTLSRKLKSATKAARKAGRKR
jgi:chromosome segregation ATPase